MAEKTEYVGAEFPIKEKQLLDKCAAEKFGGAPRAAVVRIAVKELLQKYGYLEADTSPG
jgi:hypothetical protein